MPSPTTSASKLRTLKLVVAGMGVLLVAGFLLVVVTIVERLAGRGGEAPAGRIEVALPAGCEVAEAWSDAGKLYLRLAGAGADCRQILIVQEGSGAVTSQITFTTAP